MRETETGDNELMSLINQESRAHGGHRMGGWPLKMSFTCPQGEPKLHVVMAWFKVVSMPYYIPHPWATDTHLCMMPGKTCINGCDTDGEPKPSDTAAELRRGWWAISQPKTSDIFSTWFSSQKPPLNIFVTKAFINSFGQSYSYGNALNIQQQNVTCYSGTLGRL